MHSLVNEAISKIKLKPLLTSNRKKNNLRIQHECAGNMWKMEF